MRTTIFVKLFRQFSREIKENERFREDFVKNRPWIFHYGFLLYFYCNFSLLGPGRGPPHKRARTRHLFEEFAIGVTLLQKSCEFLAFSGPAVVPRTKGPEKAFFRGISDWGQSQHTLYGVLAFSSRS